MLDRDERRRRHSRPERTGLAAAAELARHVAGEVRTSPLTRWLYSTDASIYRVLPDAVLVARSVDDLAAAAEVAARHDVPLCVRGAATSLAGQTLGAGIASTAFTSTASLEIDPERRVARVEPGVVQGALNRAAAPYGLEFGPDTSTVEQATIGGMAGNNSSGSRSIVYGETKDKLLRVRGVLAGGEAVAFGPCAGDDLRGGVTGASGGPLADGLAAMRARSRARIAAGFPRTARRVSGYNLPELLAPRAQPGPPVRRLRRHAAAVHRARGAARRAAPVAAAGAALTFASLRAALEANLAILDHGAVGRRAASTSRRCAARPTCGVFTRLGPILDGDDPACCWSSTRAARDEGLAGLDRLRARGRRARRPEPRSTSPMRPRSPRPGSCAAPRCRCSWARPAWSGPPRSSRTRRCRRSASPTSSTSSSGVVAAHGVRASFTGHASAGCMHVRPMLDLKTAAGVGRLEAIAARGGPPRGRAPRRLLGRARRRLLALVVQPGAVRSRALRRVRRSQGPVRPAAPAQPGPQGRRAGGSREPALRR